jgi:BirA family biotin operon repressor/biotin-[acetyl-CoA-carboxylase] ligase
MPNLIPNDVAHAIELARRRLGPLAEGLRWFDEVGSTSDVVAALAAAGAGEGCVVAAGAQSQGRGRLGRAWASPAGGGVYASVLLRPPSHALPLITLAAGVGLAEGIVQATGFETVLKWPNDVYAGVPAASGRKLAGVLAEASVVPGERAAVVLGFGINVAHSKLPAEIARVSTSLEAELGRPIDRGLVLVECLAAVWLRYDDVCAHRESAVLEAWRRRASPTFGRRVEWDAADGAGSGVALGVDEGGALLVRSPAGDTRLLSGEVRWKGPA